MARERLSMRKIREVLRLHEECGLSARAIARSCGIGHTSVLEYLRRAHDAGVGWADAQATGDEALERRLYPVRTSRSAIPEPDWSAVHLELKRKGVTRRLLWVEYRDRTEGGYGYSAFCERYAAWLQRAAPTMRRSYSAGQWCFVDYAGMTARYVDPETGEIAKAPVFVAVLAASNYTYIEAHKQADTAAWLAGHVNAFEEFGGAPEIVVPDNTKTAVRKACRYEPDLNPSYRDMAEHYGVAVVPARVRKPRDKAPVEVGVQITERWVLAPLRDETIVGLASLNAAIRVKRDELNDRPMQPLGKSRRQLLEELERPALRPLPERRYEFAGWENVTVGIDYHVVFDKHFYSVPFTLIHQELEIRVTWTLVEVFRRGLRIASHARSYAPGRFTTLPEHMPPEHRFVLEWSPERFVRWAAKTGPQTAGMVTALLKAKAHPEQAYRACTGLLRLGDNYGQQRLEAACQRALHYGAISYRDVKNILDAELDRLALEDATPPAPRQHELLRGADYYS